MKKNLLILGVLAASTSFAQMSPEWGIEQNTNFPNVSAGVRYLDAVTSNVVWGIGYDGIEISRNYMWFTTTSDGGNTFTSGNVYPDTNTYAIGGIEGIDAMTAYVTVYMKATDNKGAVLKTIDAGSTWTNVAAANMYTNAASFADITCFTDNMTGITMGDPVGGEFEIHRTTDAGATWVKVPNADIPNALNATEYGTTGVYTKFGTDIWFGTNKGRVYHSMDAGATWTVAAIAGASQGVSDLAFRDNMNGLCIAYSGTTAAPVLGLYSTANGGLTWTSIPVSANFGKNDMCAIPGTNIFASCGAGTGNTILSYSTDDGQNWTDWGSIDIQYLKIDFADNSSGWAGSFSDMSTGMGGMFKYSGLATSLKPLAEKTDLSVGPNPTSGMVNLTLPTSKGALSIEVIDAFGKVVYKETASNTVVGDKKQLNLESLAKGLYTISVTTPTDKAFSKIVVQ